MSTFLLSSNMKKEQHMMLMLMFAGVAAIAVLAPLISIVGFPTMSAKFPSQSNLGAICKENALKYEQLGYYTGGAAQFNAVMAICVIGSS